MLHKVQKRNEPWKAADGTLASGLTSSRSTRPMWVPLYAYLPTGSVPAGGAARCNLSMPSIPQAVPQFEI